MIALPPLKVSSLSKIALSSFLLTLSLSIRKVFIVLYPSPMSVFNEYTDVSLYLSDLMLLSFLFIFALDNRNNILSIIWWKSVFHVEHMRVRILAPLPFLVWCTISLLWSESETLSFFAILRLFEGYLLYLSLLFLFVPRGTNPLKRDPSGSKVISTPSNFLWIKKIFHVEHREEYYKDKNENVPRGTFFWSMSEILIQCSTWNIVFLTFITAGFLQSCIAICQFLLQSSLGFTFLKESVIAPNIPGVAKMSILDHTIIRSYGLFPHPNILAGFLGITLILTIAYPLVFSQKMFHVEHGVSMRYPILFGRELMIFWNRILTCFKKCSTWNMRKTLLRMFHVEQKLFLYRTVLFIQLIAFLLTFSKSAFISLFFAIVYIIFRELFHVEQFSHLINVFLHYVYKKCSTWNIKIFINKLFHVEQFVYLLILTCFCLVAIIVLRSINWNYYFLQSFHERSFLLNGYLQMIRANIWQGVGFGQGVFRMQDFFPEILQSWQFQPIHNMYLLIVAEVGVIGVFLFGYFIWKCCSTWNITLDAARMFHVEHSHGESLNRRILRNTLAAILIFLGTVSLFDHYLWDIQQGQLMFWFFLGLFTSL